MDDLPEKRFRFQVQIFLPENGGNLVRSTPEFFPGGVFSRKPSEDFPRGGRGEPTQFFFSERGRTAPAWDSFSRLDFCLMELPIFFALIVFHCCQANETSAAPRAAGSRGDVTQQVLVQSGNVFSMPFGWDFLRWFAMSHLPMTDGG